MFCGPKRCLTHRWAAASSGHGRGSRPRRSGLAEHLRDEEGELEGLDPVEPRVADRLVAVGQAGLVDLLATADALGDVVTGELDVHASRPGAEGAVDVEEALDLVDEI